ncbi:MAG: asparagine synthetase B [Candidatus Bathyarchaeia archaeon]
MGALISVISRHGKNVIPEIVKMLNVLKHRGKDAYGIATDSMLTIARSIDDLRELLNVKSDIALGYNFSAVLPSDTPQPIEAGNFKVAFTGRFFSSEDSDADTITNLLERLNDAREAAEHAINEINGSFSFVILDGHRLIVGREPLGATPLYLGVNEQIYALASERKALWFIGIKDEQIKSFPPGNLAEITRDGIVIRPVKILYRPKIEPISEEEAIRRLHAMLLDSIKRKTINLGRFSIAFSGGLDSAIIASLALEIGKKPLLISVGLEDSEELKYAEMIADEVGLPIKAEAYTLRDVEETLPRVLWLIEEDNALKASIYIPVFWIANISSKMDFNVMLSGQGSDEIFAGYHKYLREYCRSGGNIEQTLYNDVLTLHESSLEPEDKICSFNGVEVRFPYVDYSLVSFALSIPTRMKIESEGDSLRKRVLRHLAKYIGLPQEVYLRPKKAIQYGTGVSKALKKIASRKGLNLQKFISQMFQKIEWFKNGDCNNILA